MCKSIYRGIDVSIFGSEGRHEAEAEVVINPLQTLIDL